MESRARSESKLRVAENKDIKNLKVLGSCLPLDGDGKCAISPNHSPVAGVYLAKITLMSWLMSFDGVWYVDSKG